MVLPMKLMSHGCASALWPHILYKNNALYNSLLCSGR